MSRGIDNLQRGDGVLLPYQRAWIADTSPVKVCEKSRRIGLSWCEAADDALTAASRSGMDVWYIGYNKDMALEFINDVAFWVRHYNEAASEMEETVVEDEDHDILAYRIKFDSGHRVTALTSRPSNLRGKQGKVVIDEAAFHEDLRGLLKAAIALLMWGGRVVVISTHDGEDNPFNELVNEIRAGKKAYSIHRITLGDALRQGLYRRICQSLGRDWSEEGEAEWRRELVDLYGDDAEEELFCVPSKGSGAVLTRTMIESCMTDDAPVLRWSCKPEFAESPEAERKAAAQAWCEEHLAALLDALPENYPSFFGEDFGRVGDLTVIVPLLELPLLTYGAPFIVELRAVPFRQQEQVLFFIVDKLPRFRGGALDARGNGSYLAEVAMQRYGSSRIQQVMFSEKWYIEQMPSYKSAFEDRSIILPRDADILDDHMALRSTRGVIKIPENERGKGRDGKQRHGDSAIAGALAWFAARTMTGGPIEYESVDRRRFGEQQGAY